MGSIRYVDNTQGNFLYLDADTEEGAQIGVRGHLTGIIKDEELDGDNFYRWEADLSQEEVEKIVEGSVENLGEEFYETFGSLDRWRWMNSRLENGVEEQEVGEEEVYGWIGYLNSIISEEIERELGEDLS